MIKMKILAVALILHSIFATGNNSNRVQNFIEGNGQFTANLYKEMIKTRTENFVVCPISVQIVLALTSVGAKGKTMEELTTTLRIPHDVAEIEKTFEEITPLLNKTGNYTLVSANKIYIKNDLELNPDYENSATEYFGSGIESVDFLSEETIPEINDWVSQSTFGMIENFIPPGSFDESTQLALINALYFTGTWKKIFNKNLTTKKPFFVNESMERETEMMEKTDTLKYAYNVKLRAEFLELPYKDSDVSLIIALPNDINGIALLEACMEEVLEPQVYDNRNVLLQMPTFTTVSTIQLKNVLMEMGIKEAFSQLADFSGIVVDGGRSLTISDVFQKAIIEVYEEGTSAAAATGVIVVTTAVQETVNIIVNHPFIYYLKSKSTGILFIGRYVTP